MKTTLDPILRGAARALVALAVLGLVPTPSSGDEPRLDAEELRERLGSNWVPVRTPSVRVFVRPGAWPARADLLAVEQELQTIATRLRVDAAVMAALRVDPIDYFVVDEPGVLESFGVGDVEGLAFPEHRLIFSRRLPHEHELVHVMMHLAVARRPAANQPFLQEGLASYLGGNGMDGRFAVLAHGDRVLDQGSVDLAALWTATGWQRSALDAYDRYAVAARFVQYLVEARGDAGPLLELTRLLAGNAEAVDQRPWSALRVQIEGVYELRWEELLVDFARWRSEHPAAGLREIAPPLRAPDVVTADDRHLIRVWFEPDSWVIAARAQRGPLDVELFWGEPRAIPRGMAPAPSLGQRFRLHLDAEQLVLIDQNHDRTLLREIWQQVGTSHRSHAISGTRSGESPRERVWSFGAELAGELGMPATMGVWSRPAYEPR